MERKSESFKAISEWRAPPLAACARSCERDNKNACKKSARRDSSRGVPKKISSRREPRCVRFLQSRWPRLQHMSPRSPKLGVSLPSSRGVELDRAFLRSRALSSSSLELSVELSISRARFPHSSLSLFSLLSSLFS